MIPWEQRDWLGELGTAATQGGRKALPLGILAGAGLGVGVDTTTAGVLAHMHHTNFFKK